MASLDFTVTVAVDLPDVRPGDVHLLRDVAETLPHRAAELTDLADRIVRMLLTAPGRLAAPEDRQT